MIRTAPTNPLFPYTTLFRSQRILQPLADEARVDVCRPAGRERNDDAHGTVRIVLCGADRRGEGGKHGEQRRSEEHTSELQSRLHIVCRLLLEKKKRQRYSRN